MSHSHYIELFIPFQVDARTSNMKAYHMWQVIHSGHRGCTHVVIWYSFHSAFNDGHSRNPYQNLKFVDIWVKAKLLVYTDQQLMCGILIKWDASLSEYGNPLERRCGSWTISAIFGHSNSVRFGEFSWANSTDFGKCMQSIGLYCAVVGYVDLYGIRLLVLPGESKRFRPHCSATINLSARRSGALPLYVDFDEKQRNRPTCWSFAEPC